MNDDDPTTHQSIGGQNSNLQQMISRFYGLIGALFILLGTTFLVTYLLGSPIFSLDDEILTWSWVLFLIPLIPMFLGRSTKNHID